MRKIFVSLIPSILVVLVFQTAYADSHISTAEPTPKGTFTAGYQEEYFHSKRVQLNGENDFHGSSILLNYAPFSAFELFLSKKTFLNNNSKILSALQSVSLSRSELGSKISIPFSAHSFMGFETAYVLFNGTNSPVFRASSGRFRTLHTYLISDFKFHLNTEFFYNQSKKIMEGFDSSRFGQNELYGVSKHNLVNYGLGLEWATAYVSPYLYYSLDQALGAKVPPFFKNPNRLTFGAHIAPCILSPWSSPWKINLGFDYGLANKRLEGISLTPRFNIFAGLSFTSHASTAPAVTQVTPEKSPKKSEEKIEEKKEEKAEEKSEAPKTSAYPIYPIGSSVPEEVSLQEITLPTPLEIETIQNWKWPIYPIKKKIVAKKPKEIKETPVAPVERSLPEAPITTQVQPPVIVEKSEKPKEKAKPETNNAPSKEFEKNYSEESPDKDFLNQFR